MQLVDWTKKNTKLVAFMAVGILLLIVFIISRSATATVKIIAYQEAKIFISDSQGGEFEEVGTGEVTRTIAPDEPLYIRAELNDRVSVGGVELESGEKVDYLIPTKERSPNELEKFFDGPVSDLYVEGEEGFGIAPSSKAVVNFGVKRFLPPRSEYIDVPAAKKVFWESRGAYVVESISRGVGIYKGNLNLLLSEGSSPNFVAVDRFSTDTPFALVSPNEVHTLDKVGPEFNKIADIDGANSRLAVLTTKDRILVLEQPFPGEYTDSIDSKIGTIEKEFRASTDVTSLGYDGSNRQEFAVSGASVFGAISNQGGIVFLTDHYITDGDKLWASYFDSNENVVTIGERHFVLNEGGLWEGNPDNGSLYLLTELKDGEMPLTRSLQVVNGALRFGTVQDPSSDVKVVGSIYDLAI